MTETTRFAPSPSGRLHLGHAHSALFSASDGGRFLLRIEDIDVTRCKPEFEAAIFEDLAWLGLTWEEPVRRQSAHMADYQAALEALQAEKLLYPCFCTRRDIQEEIERSGAAPHGPEGPLYPGICRELDPSVAAERIAWGEAHAWRIRIDAALARTGPLTWHDRAAGEQQARPELQGDVVLARKDIATSYHLAVTVDDALQEITLVTRGKDLFHATHIHRLLQALLDLPVPEWHHHGLLEDETGKRLAKRHDALSIAALRQSGKSAEEVRALAGFPDQPNADIDAS